MTLKVKVEGIYETKKGVSQKDYTNFNFDINVDRVKQAGIETHILRRFIPMIIKKKKNAPVCDKVTHFIITDIQKIDDKISIAGKDIKEMNEWEIQNLAALFDLYEIPLPNTMSITAMREKAILTYLKNVANINVDDNKVRATLSCYDRLPNGTYKFNLKDDDKYVVDVSLLKDSNIKETKTVKQNITELLNKLSGKSTEDKSEQTEGDENKTPAPEETPGDKLKGLSDILQDV